MTFAELQARAALLASFDGWLSANPLPSWPDLVNEAWRRFSWEGELTTGTVTATAVSGQSSYPLAPFMKRVLDVVVGGVGLFRSRPEYERFLSPAWRTKSGTPLRFAQESTSAVSLIPAPTTGAAITVFGVVEALDMVDDTDEPGVVSGVGDAIPSNLHEAVALKAAILQGQVAMQGESSARMQSYEAEYAGFVSRALAANGRLEDTDG